MQFMRFHAWIVQELMQAKREECFLSDVMNIKKNINLNEKYHNVVTKDRINNKNDTGCQHNFD